MTTTSMALNCLLDKAGSEEFLRSALENTLQLSIDKGVTGQIKAAWRERTPEHGNYWNGYRGSRLESGLGSCSRIFPSFVVAHTFRNLWSRVA